MTQPTEQVGDFLLYKLNGYGATLGFNGKPVHAQDAQVWTDLTNLGVSQVRLNITPEGYMMPVDPGWAPGKASTFDWTNVDPIVEAANVHHFRVTMIARGFSGSSKTSYSPNPCDAAQASANPPAPRYITDVGIYQELALALARRYSGDGGAANAMDTTGKKRLIITNIEIGNEEFDTYPGAGDTTCRNPLRYVSYVRQIIPMMRKPVSQGGGNWTPDATRNWPALVGMWGEWYQDPTHIKDCITNWYLPAFDTTFNNPQDKTPIIGKQTVGGVSVQMIDYINFHNYKNAPPTTEYSVNVEMQDILNIMRNLNKDTTTPLWMTEFGQNGPCAAVSHVNNGTTPPTVTPPTTADYNALEASQLAYFKAVMPLLVSGGLAHCDIFTLNYGIPTDPGFGNNIYVGQVDSIAFKIKAGGYYQTSSFAWLRDTFIPANPNLGSGNSGGGGGGGGTPIFTQIAADTFKNRTTTGGAAPTSTPHACVVFLENRSFKQITGPGNGFTHVNAFMNNYGNATNYFGVSHQSLTNYLAFASGSDQGGPADTSLTTYNGNCLVDSLDGVGVAWKQYIENIPSPGYTGNDTGGYIKHHTPWVYFNTFLAQTTAYKQAHLVDYTNLAGDLTAGTAPPIFFVQPNNTDNGHNGTTDTACDNFVSGLVSTIQASTWYTNNQGIIILWWDESNPDTDVSGFGDPGSNAKYPHGGHTACIVISAANTKNVLSSQVNHYGLLHALNVLYGLPALGFDNHRVSGSLVNGDLTPLLSGGSVPIPSSGWGAASDGTSGSWASFTEPTMVAPTLLKVDPTRFGQFYGDATSSACQLLGAQTMTDGEVSVRTSISVQGTNTSLVLRSNAAGTIYYRCSLSGDILECSYMDPAQSGGRINLYQSAALNLDVTKFYYLRFRIIGNTLQGRYWVNGSMEPQDFTNPAYAFTHTLGGADIILASGQFGLRARTTGVSQLVTYDSFIANSITQSSSGPTPGLAVSTPSLSFTSIIGGSNPVDQSITLSETAGLPVDWTLSGQYGTNGGGWLTSSDTAGSLVANGSQSITISCGASADGISTPGTYTCLLSFVATTGDSNTVTVNVTYVLTNSSSPALGTNPASLFFAAIAGGVPPASQPSTLSELAGIGSAWTSSIGYSSATGWLAISPTSGTLAASGSQVVTYTCTPGALAAGTYTATVTYTATTGSATITESVVFTITGVSPQPETNPSVLSFFANTSDVSPAAQSVLLSNIGGSSSAWTAVTTYDPSASGWLATSPTSGTLAIGGSVSATYTATTGNLPVGTYTATTTYTMGGGSTASVISTFKVSPSGQQERASAVPATLSFFTTIGGASPVPQTDTLTNIGGTAASWTAQTVYSHGKNWLITNPNLGTLLPGASVPITYTCTTAHLPVGVYTATTTYTMGSSADTVVTTCVVSTTTPIISTNVLPEIESPLPPTSPSLGYSYHGMGSIPVFLSAATLYSVNGVVLDTQPIVATTPATIAGNVLVKGSTFTLIFSRPSSNTLTLLADGTTLSLTFPTAHGSMVSGPVVLASTLAGDGITFQVLVTLLAHITIDTRIIQTPFN